MRLKFVKTVQNINNLTWIQSWKKLQTVHAARVDIFSRIEDILVQKSRTYVLILDLCGVLINQEVNVEEWG